MIFIKKYMMRITAIDCENCNIFIDSLVSVKVGVRVRKSRIKTHSSAQYT